MPMWIVPGRVEVTSGGGLGVNEAAAPRVLPRVRITHPDVVGSVDAGTRLIVIMGEAMHRGSAEHGLVALGGMQLGHPRVPEWSTMFVIPVVTEVEWDHRREARPVPKWCQAEFVWLAESEVAARPVLWQSMLDAVPAG